MPQRLALVAASVAAAIVLTIGLAAAGFGPSLEPGRAADAEVTEATASTEVAADPSLEPKIVYIKPAPTPKTVILKKQAKAGAAKSSAAKATPTRVVRKARRNSDDREDDARERREHEREVAQERRKKAAERAKERREESREDDD